MSLSLTLGLRRRRGTPEPSAPTITATDSLDGRVLTINASTTGYPSPVVTLTTLTLDAVDVSGDATQITGTQFRYVVPSDVAAQTVAWEVTATNSEGTDTDSGTESVPADAPEQIDGANWSVAANGESNGATITLDGQTPTNGVTPNDTEWSQDGGATWDLLGGTVGDFDITGLPNGTSSSIIIRSVATFIRGASSAAKTVTASGVPSSFGPGGWTIENDGTGGDATLGVTSPPADNGATITDVEYRINGGTPASLGGVEGSYSLTDLFTDDVASLVEIRAVNANGESPWSAPKTVTTTNDITITDNGDGTVSANGITGAITVVLTAPAEYAGTYTQDIDGTALNTANLPQCYIAPVISGDGSPAAGEDVTLDSIGFWVYEDESEPTPATDWEADTAGNATFASLSDTDATYTLTASESGDDIRNAVSLTDDVGTNTYYSNVLSVAAAPASAMEADTSGFYWFDPDDIVADGSNNITSWPNAKTNSGSDLAQLGSLTRPTLSGGGALFNGSAVLGTSGVPTDTMASLLTAGESVCLFVVANLSLGSGRVSYLAEGNTTSGTGDFQHYFGHVVNTNGALIAKAGQASEALNIEGTEEAGTVGTKQIYEMLVTQSSVDILRNNVSKGTGTVTAANFATWANSRLRLGARSSGSAIGGGATGTIFEVFATTDVTTSNRNAIRSELATIHGITL